MPDKVPIDIGLTERLARKATATIAGAIDAWFGPLNPIPPIAQEQSKGRVWNYPVGYNLRWVPKQGEGYDHNTLRGMADSCAMLRLAIETRKDQMESLPWGVRTKGQTQISETEDPRIADIKVKLARPDGVHSYSQWQRMGLEDMLVIDAMSHEPRFNNGGECIGFDPIDGATIRPFVDLQGRRPYPPEPAYGQYLNGVIANHLTADELIYSPRNLRTNHLYGFSPVEQLMMIVDTALRRDLHKQEFYTKGSVPDGLLELPETYSGPEALAQFQETWDGLMKNDTQFRRDLKMIPQGSKYTATKDAVLADQFDQWLARIICYAFSLSPAAFVETMNRGTAETIQQEAHDQGLRPLMMWWSEFMNYLIQHYFGYTDIEFYYEREDSDDPLKAAQADVLLLQNGVVTIDDLRQDRGKKPLGAGGTMKPMIWLGTGIVSVEDALAGKAGPVAMPPVDAAPEDGSFAYLKKKASRLTVPHNPGQAKEESRLGKKIRHAFRAAAYRLSRIICAGYTPADADKVEKITMDEARVLASQFTLIIENDEFPEYLKLKDEVQESITLVAVDSARIAFKAAQLADPSKLAYIEEYAVAYAKDRAARLVGKRWVGHVSTHAALATDDELIDSPNPAFAITNATREALKSTITQAVEGRWDVPKLRDNLVHSYTFSEARARCIARTELAFAHNEGVLESWKAAGGVITGKRWILSPVHDERDECTLNAAQGIIPLTDVFQSGAMMPPQHPNCRCAMGAESVEEYLVPDE